MLWDTPGEVAALRGQFVAMLFNLIEKRAAAKAPAPPNPLCGKQVSPAFSLNHTTKSLSQCGAN